MVDDFHFMSVQNPIEPFLLVMDSHRAGYLSLRIASENIHQTLNRIEGVFASIMPARTFEYQFLDEDFDRQYDDDKKFGTLFIYLTALAIMIACLGLFGLASFSISRRTKEIATRKVLGASISDLSLVLAKNFLLLVSVACIFAIPIAWLAMRIWLEEFAYRIEPGVMNFFLAGVLAMGVAILTISFHVFRAARGNPIESLRNQ